jgi:uncharacterized protein YjbI with pentapeptide repeats
VYLTGVRFMGVHLTGVYLTGVYLIGVYLVGVYLIGVYLIGMYLIGMYLIGLYLMGVHLNPQQIIKEIFLLISILTNNRRTSGNRELLGKTPATVDRLLVSVLRMEPPRQLFARILNA